MKDITTKMQAYLDNLTKPKGSLGDLENISIKVAKIQKKIPPFIKNKAAFVFASDQGITDEGVSLYPKEVTYQMVLNFLSGGAAASVMSKFYNYELFVVDCGVDKDINFNNKDHSYKKNKFSNFINKKVNYGTQNFLKSPSMSEKELYIAFENGKDIANLIVKKGFDLITIGDMGIGNTTVATAMVVASGFGIDEIVDRGTGIDDNILKHKKEIIIEGVKKYKKNIKGPYDILRYLGGFEFATMVSLILNLEDKGVCVVVDGFPVMSAFYIAYLINNNITDFVFAGHRSKVKGHYPLLKRTGLKPIVDLNMRLGEGTGAIIGGSIIELSCYVSKNMASFTDAGVSRSEKDEKNY